MIMTMALQFSAYDMCHCHNNLNSAHTLNMIVYFCPFGLQFDLLQQTQMHWPSWFQDLESYQPMGGGLSLVQLTAVIWCSFERTKLTKPLHQTTCSTMHGAFVTLMAMAASCSRKILAPLGQIIPHVHTLNWRDNTLRVRWHKNPGGVFGYSGLQIWSTTYLSKSFFWNGGKRFASSIK